MASRSNRGLQRPRCRPALAQPLPASNRLRRLGALVLPVPIRLSADRRRGECRDLLQTSREKTFARWSRVGRVAAPEAYVRKLMLNALISTRRRRVWSRDRLGEVSVDSPVPPGGLRGRPRVAVAAGMRPAGAAEGRDRAAQATPDIASRPEAGIADGVFGGDSAAGGASAFGCRIHRPPGRGDSFRVHVASPSPGRSRVRPEPAAAWPWPAPSRAHRPRITPTPRC